MKLSEAIRAFGWNNKFLYQQCVLGCAYRGVTGKDLFEAAGCNAEKCITVAAQYFGVSFNVAKECEKMCFLNKSKNEIAKYVEQFESETPKKKLESDADYTKRVLQEITATAEAARV